MKYWNRVTETSPAEGMPVLVLHESSLTPRIAYYCDRDFYSLEFDPVLGVMRKHFVSEPVKYWANYITPNTEELYWEE